MMLLPDYIIRHSPRAKNLRLKVTRDGGLCVVVPRGFDEKKIPPILNRKKVWIADTMKRIGETKRFIESQPAQHLPEKFYLMALGEILPIIYREDKARTGIRLLVENGGVVLSGATLDRDAVIRKLKGWLRLRVRDSLFPIAQELADKHHLNLRGLLVKSQRTRWASCSAKKNLSLNTKLLFLPPELVRYVLTHELCHTVHMNHSQDFWRVVASYEPSYRALDKALREAWKIIPQWVF